MQAQNKNNRSSTIRLGWARVIGFFLLGGIAPQSFAIGFCGLILQPLHLVVSGGGVAKELDRKFILRVCGLLVALFFSFHLFAWIAQDFEWNGIRFNKSKLSASLVGFSILAVLFSHVGGGRKENAIEKPGLDEIFLQFFRGLRDSSVLLVIVCLAQHWWGINPLKFFNGEIQMPESSLMSETTYRASGSFGHPLTMAGVSLGVMGLAATIASASPLKFFSLSRQLVCLHLVVVLLTGARMALAIAAVFLLIQFRKDFLRGGKYLFLMLPALGIYMFFSHGFTRYWQVYQRMGNGDLSWLGHRVKFWQVHWQMFLEKLWFGHGFNNLTTEYRAGYYNNLAIASKIPRYNAHNFYLETLVCLGMVGTVFVAAIGYALWKQIRAKERQTLIGELQWRQLNQAFASAFVLNLLHGLIQNTFYDSAILNFYLAIVGFMIWRYRTQGDAG